MDGSVNYMPFKSCRFYRKTNSLSSSSVKRWSTLECDSMCRKGTLCSLSHRSGFLRRNPPSEHQLGKRDHCALPECRRSGLVLSLRVAGEGKKKLCFGVCKASPGLTAEGPCLLCLQRGVCKSSKGGVSVWFTSLRACVCVCQRYIWAGMYRGGWEGTEGRGRVAFKKDRGGEKKRKRGGWKLEWMSLRTKKEGMSLFGIPGGWSTCGLYALHVPHGRLRLTVGHCGKVDSSARKKKGELWFLLSRRLAVFLCVRWGRLNCEGSWRRWKRDLLRRLGDVIRFLLVKHRDDGSWT